MLLFIDSAISGVMTLEGACVRVVLAIAVCVAGGVEILGIDPEDPTFRSLIDSFSENW